MFQYIIKRILIFIPTFFIISLLIFGLSKLTSGDPVLVIIKGASQTGDTGQRADLAKGEQAYAEKAAELGLDKPAFYFALTSMAYPKDLYQIQKANHRQLISRLIDQYGSAELALAYYHQLKEIQYSISDIPTDYYTIRVQLSSNVNDLYLDYDHNGIHYKLNEVATALQEATQQDTSNNLDIIYQQWQVLTQHYNALRANTNKTALYIPQLHFYGLGNQYHTWMFGDYPWWRTVDSTNHLRIEELSEQIKALRPAERVKSRSISTLKGKNYRLQKQIENPETNSTTVDSLQLQLVSNNTEIEAIQLQKAKISEEIALLFEEQRERAKNIEHYTSKGFLRGDFGISYTDGQKVSSRITHAMYWTIIMNLVAILLAYLISIPLGVNSAKWKLKGRKKVDNFTTTLLFLLYSLPNFWIGTLLVMFFTTAEYAEWMDLFPTSGAQDLDIRDDPNSTAWDVFWNTVHHLILPIFCITYGSLAYLSRQMRGSMLGVLRQDYIRTARAKGLSERKVVWKHAFRNSLFPIITLFSSVFPRTLSGAIAIEVIFAIHGMGFELLHAIGLRDWPVVFAIVMLISILAMIGNLVADILYAVVDPRIKY